MSASSYFLASAADEPGGRGASSGCRAAQLDPNAPGAIGVSFDDGSFRYHDASGGAVRFRLYSAALPVTHDFRPTSDEEPLMSSIASSERVHALASTRGSPTPTPVGTAWARWSFVPGHPGLLLVVLPYSPHLLLTSLPACPPVEPPGGQGVRAWVCSEVRRPSVISTLCCCSLGEWVGVGQQDGTVTFFQLPQESAPPEGAVEPRCHVHSHSSAVSCVTLLHDVCEGGELLETVLGASGAADQSLVVYDLRAGAPLHRILTADTRRTTLRVPPLPPLLPPSLSLPFRHARTASNALTATPHRVPHTPHRSVVRLPSAPSRRSTCGCSPPARRPLVASTARACS